MKKEDYNNPYRKTPNRIGNVKGQMGVFNEPTKPTKGYIEEIEPDFDDDDNEIVITISLGKFVFWFLVIELICLIFNL
jgi:hypothetical protein